MAALPAARRAVLTLAIGAVGAAIFLGLGFPAPVLAGPALAVTLAGLAGLQTGIPNPLRDLCFVILGVGIGANVTPEVIEAVGLWPISLVVLGVLTVIGIRAARAMLERVFLFAPVSAFLAAVPGHLSFVLALGAERDADMPRVTLVQSLRVLLITLCVPVIVGLSAEIPEGLAPPQVMALREYLALIVASGLLGLAILRLRLPVPAPLLLSGIALSTVAHLSGFSSGRSPLWLSYGAFLVLGSLIGTRFRGTTLAVLRSALWAGVAVTALVGGLAFLAAEALAPLIGLPPALLLMAFAPGGLEVMIAMSVQLDLNPAFVTAHHVFRLLFLSVLIPVMIPSRDRF